VGRPKQAGGGNNKNLGVSGHMNLLEISRVGPGGRGTKLKGGVGFHRIREALNTQVGGGGKEQWGG